MITSIFSKSKPVNFIIITGFIVFIFVISNFDLIFSDISHTLNAVFRLGIVIFLVFLLDFIISKNKLTKSNSYGIMTFGLMFGMFPEALRYSELLLANLFILFALRRLISLHSNVQIKKKFFDAGLWIMLASLFYFWAILFFALVLVALIYHANNDIKNVVIPFIGVITVLVLLMVYNSCFYDCFVRPSNFERYASLDFSPYTTKAFILKLSVLLISVIWTLVYFFKILPDKNKQLRPSFFLIAWTSIIALLIAAIAPVKNGSEFLFLFAPYAIIMANYIEVAPRQWLKYGFVIVLIVTPIISAVL